RLVIAGDEERKLATPREGTQPELDPDQRQHQVAAGDHEQVLVIGYQLPAFLGVETSGDTDGVDQLPAERIEEPASWVGVVRKIQAERSCNEPDGGGEKHQRQATAQTDDDVDR